MRDTWEEGRLEMALLEALEDAYDAASRWVFGPTPRERARQAQMQVRQAQRDLERERWTLQQRRTKCEAELREAAKKASSLDELRSVASEISRIRGAMANVDRMSRLLDGVAAKALSASTSVAVSGVLQSVTETLSGINGAESTASLARVVRDFERETMRMEAHDEAMQARSAAPLRALAGRLTASRVRRRLPVSKTRRRTRSRSWPGCAKKPTSSWLSSCRARRAPWWPSCPPCQSRGPRLRDGPVATSLVAPRITTTPPPRRQCPYPTLNVACKRCATHDGRRVRRAPQAERLATR